MAVVLILIVIFVLFQIAMPKFTILQTLIDRLNLVTREILTGIPVIRAFSREEHEEERFEKANSDLTRTNLFVNRCMTFMMPVMMLIMNGVSVAIIYFGAHGVDSGNMQVGNMMAFIQYCYADYYVLPDDYQLFLLCFQEPMLQQGVSARFWKWSLQ